MKSSFFTTLWLLPVTLLVITGCQSHSFQPDASGNFEAREIRVSALGQGKLLSFQVQEGQTYPAGAWMGTIDTTPLYYQCREVRASIRALLRETPDIAAQINVLEAQLEEAKREATRTGSLFLDSAATAADLDQARSRVRVLEKQIRATDAVLGTQKNGLMAQVLPLQMKLDRLEDLLSDYLITNPVSGTVLTRFVRQGEVVSYGEVLYSIANLDTLELRAYVTGDQLAAIHLGQQVKVLIDSARGECSPMAGRISWISEESEFTPKMIPTRQQRANLVYAIKIKVHNPGDLHIGAPADVLFQ
ncbi:MAG: HlyD family secretion protein [Chitinophagaceae bacterium]